MAQGKQEKLGSYMDVSETEILSIENGKSYINKK